MKTDDKGKQTYYVYGLGLIGQEQNGVYQTYHFDMRGSTVALTDVSGKVTDRFQYNPYGELVYRSGNTNTPFLFSGRYGVITDTNGLYYMRARYYDPVTKRFLSRDTLVGRVSDPQLLNRYTYCVGNPMNYVDPTGYEGYPKYDPLYPFSKARPLNTMDLWIIENQSNDSSATADSSYNNNIVIPLNNVNPWAVQTDNSNPQGNLLGIPSDNTSDNTHINTGPSVDWNELKSDAQYVAGKTVSGIKGGCKNS